MIWSVHIPSSDMNKDRVLRTIETCENQCDLIAKLLLKKTGLNKVVKRVGFLVH